MATDVERSGMDMGGPHEPSYYEIALTNRQVVVAFIVLLVCLVAAFFSGVWIGRESSTRAFAQLARATPPGAGSAAAGSGTPSTDGTAAAGAAGAGERPDGQALQEFKFFNDQKKKPAAEAHPGRQEKGRAVAPPEPAAEATPERQESPRAAAPVAAVKAAPPAATPSRPPAGAAGEGEPMPPAAAAGRSRRAATAASAEPRPAPVAVRPVAEAAAPTAAVAPIAPSSASSEGPREAKRPAEGPQPAALGAGSVVIQVFSSSDKAQAEKIRERLVKAGQEAFLSPIEKGGQTMYRVRLGPFPSREKAEKVADQVRREQKLDTWITPR
jgi:cell division septation protein DedD